MIMNISTLVKECDGKKILLEKMEVYVPKTLLKVVLTGYPFP